MNQAMTVQGRQLTATDIDYIRQLIAKHPTWSRRKLSIALSEAWHWRNAKGDLKDMACRTLMLKLHQRGHIELPKRRQTPTSRMAQRHIPSISHDDTDIVDPLQTLRPLRVVVISNASEYERLYNCLLSRYHYLGYTSPVGENMKYLVLSNSNQPLACLLFGSSAWSCAARDRFIGWDSMTRQRHIQCTTNNARFLVLPWVQVPHLASHILALVCRRLSQDWQSRYGHPVHLLETFVDKTRFVGTCYKAANWHAVGETCGRGRNDRHTQLGVPIKSVFIYPLTPDYRTKLTS